MTIDQSLLLKVTIISRHFVVAGFRAAIVTHDETIITNRKYVFYSLNCETRTTSVKL